MTDTFRDPSVQVLIDLARPEEHDAVLDYACGIGIATLAIAPAVASVLAVDEVAATLDEGRRLVAELGMGNVVFSVVDLYQLPFTDAEFSLVISRGAVHRLPEPTRALHELRRVGGEGARIVIADAVVDSVTDEAFNDLARLREPAHRRHYRAEQLEALARDAGLRVAERRVLRRTVDLDYWLQAASVPTEKGELIRSRVQALPVKVLEHLDVAFSDRTVSFSTDLLALRLERA
ncbi:MAG: methyltransferase domain-containing protein [Thermoleophilia bacterium]|nr:methyltransferase domain-containing protein [Thermoleophilia bacterium]